MTLTQGQDWQSLSNGPLDFSGLFPSPLAPGLQLLLALLTPFSPPEILWTNLLFEGNQYFLIFSENFRLLQCIPLFQERKEETCAIDSDVILPRTGGGKIWVSVNGIQYSLICRIPWLREKPETEVGMGLCSWEHPWKSRNEGAAGWFIKAQRTSAWVSKTERVPSVLLINSFIF